MVSEKRISITKSNWQQAKKSVELAKKSWDLLVAAQNSMMNSHDHLGIEFDSQRHEFSRLLSEQSQRYCELLDHMIKMEQRYKDMEESINGTFTHPD